MDDKCKKCPNKRFQESVIKKTLKLNSSQIHKCSIDSSLHIDENIRLCKKKLHISKDLNPKTKSVNKIERFLEAQERYNKHKDKSKISDNSKLARHRFEMENLSSANYNKWLRQPNRYDIIGVD